MNVNLYRNTDKILGSVICTILGLAPKKNDFGKINSIAIIKLWAVGESVLTLPMIHSIKEKYPQAKITVIARKRNYAVYCGLDFIDEIILFEPENLWQAIKLFKKFDLAIDCEPYLNISAIIGRFIAKKQIGFAHGARAKLYNQSIDYNDQQHVVKTYLDLAKLLGIDKKYDALIKLKYSTEDQNKIETLLKLNKISKKDALIGVCASVAESGKNRMWPNENYAKLIDHIIKKYNAKVLLIGAKNDLEHDKIKKLCEQQEKVINLSGKTNLKELFALVKHCKLFISNDTGPMHVAAAQGVKTIGIFGPNLPTRFAPYGAKNKSLYVKQYCSPCINVHKGAFPPCYNEIKGKCIKDITPKMAIDEVNKCLT